MWYQDAVIYSVDVRRFADSNGDGIGDFPGLTAKLPYLSSLGVSLVWLLPFFETPGYDNGYDVSNYYRVDPNTGTLQDFIHFVQKAGEHGIRVIADLVVNHTSNEHPWFEASRRDPKSRFRNFYMWTDMPPKLDPDDTPIFPGEEDSVWTYDEIARSYYFHRFYKYQPDLNVANDEVRHEITKIIDFWMAFGLAGFRVDAAPIIVGENGLASSEPEDPHGPLRDMHRELCHRMPDGLLVGEANVPPAEIKKFFGQGDQLGLLFNFLLNSYLYHALAREEAAPITEALTLLPVPPEKCGWANFLRTLDELDLSRLTEADRQETFAVFARDPDMRLYERGIRRRLAPMLEGDQRRLEMIHSLLFSLPGSPTLVYGDEIGLGEDLSQDARNSVRVPMQWSGGRNAGFSSAAATKLVQPIVKQGKFSHRRVNVEKQDADPNSLLNKIRRFSVVRRESEAIKRAALQAIHTGHKAVLGHRCQHDGGGLIMLHNLSRKPARVSINSGFSGEGSFTDLISNNVITFTDGQIQMTLPPYGYSWGQLSSPAAETK
ncbi:alpha-amylase family protein [Terrihabitans sp. B22-R8]|uniref:alpha-amylase family protein n=1 Tax=Terrihabitans sp. B22-R8 TaxID=3425128 RepID=UPI00403C9FA5